MPYKLFPVITNQCKCAEGTPTSIPWEMIAPFAKQAEANHCGQTLEVLSERGGLSPGELYAVIHNTDCFKLRDKFGLENFGASLWLIEYQKNCKLAEKCKRLEESNNVFEKNSENACKLQDALNELVQCVTNHPADAKRLATALETARPFLPY